MINFIKDKFRSTYHKFLNYKFLFGNIKFIFCKIFEKCKLDKRSVLRKYIFGEYKTVLVMPVYNVEESITVIQDLLPQIKTDNALLLIILNGRKKANVNKFSQFEKLTKNIKIKYDKRKLGSVMSFNIGTKYALSRYSPTYVGFVSDHDKIAPNWLRSLVTQLDTDEKIPFSWAPTIIKDYKNPASFDEQEEEFEKATLKLGGIKKLFQTKKMLHTALTHLLGDTSHGKSNSMIYGIFRANVFNHIGLIPLSLFPDVIFLLKIAVRYDLPMENEKTFREDKRSSKNQTPSEVVQNQLNVVFGYETKVSIDDGAIKNYLRMYMNVLKENFEGRYLLKNMSYEHYILFESLHRLNVIRKFSHLLDNKTSVITSMRKM